MYLRNSLLFFFCLSIAFNTLFADEVTPEQLGFTSFSIDSDELGKVNYYVYSNDLKKEKPLLVYLDGSGAFPLFQYTPKGIASTIILDCKTLVDDYHLLFLSKPGVPFIDSVIMGGEHQMPYYEPPAEYNKRLSLEWRVNAVSLAISDVLESVKVDPEKIAIVGISEGFQVGTKLASQDDRVSHAMLFVGNGLNQFYDFIIQQRIDAATGTLTEEEAQHNIDSLHQVFKDIYEDPSSTEKQWYGHTYLRWSSFCSNIPTENLNEIDIPLYIVACSKDRNTTALSADYLFLDQLRFKKTNMTYIVYPYDHSFTEIELDETGRMKSVKRHHDEVFSSGLTWLKEH